MPRYYYHVRTETGLRPDTKGRECPDLHEAILHAYVYVLKTLRGPAPLRSLLTAAIDVADGSGSSLFSLPFSSVVTHLSETEMTAWSSPAFGRH